MATIKTNTKEDQLRQAFAGGLSGAVTRFLSQPLDVIKIRFQLQVEPITKQSLPSKYRSIFQASRLIYHEEGIRAFWKGHNPAQILSIIYGIAQFWSYEQIDFLASQTSLFRDRRKLRNFMSGALAGSTATIVSTPFDVIRTRLIAQDFSKGYTNATQAVGQIVRIEGVRGLYRGVVPSMIQVAPLMGSNFMFYQFFCDWVCQIWNIRDKSDIPPWGLFIIGATSGICSKSLVYPLDLAKKRLQIQGFKQFRTHFGKHFECRGVVSCLRQTILEEGIAGLYKGMTPSIIKSATAVAINFTAYDVINRMIKDYG